MPAVTLIAAELGAVGVTQVLVPDGAGPPKAGLSGEGLAEVIQDPAALAGWIRMLLVDGPREHIDSLRLLIRSFAPNVVAIDTQALTGIAAI